MDASGAARSILELLGVLSLPVVSSFVFVFLWGIKTQEVGEYSVAENAAGALKISAVLAGFCFFGLVNAQWANIRTIMKAHPVWGIYVVALCVTTAFAVVLAYLLRLREPNTVDILSQQFPRSEKFSFHVKGAGLVLGTIAWAIAVLVLWLISRPV